VNLNVIYTVICIRFILFKLTIVLTLILVLFGRIFFNSSDTELNYRQGTNHMHMHVSTCMTQTGAALGS